MNFPGSTSGKEPICQYRTQQTQVRFLGLEDPLEEGLLMPGAALKCLIG